MTHRFNLSTWFLAITALTIIPLAGCSATKLANSEAPAETPLVTTDGEDELCPIPDWYTYPPDDIADLHVPGTSVSRDLQTSFDKATLEARGNLSQLIQDSLLVIEQLVTDELEIDEESVLEQNLHSVIQASSRQNLVGTRIHTKTEPCREGDLWRAYVLISYPKRAMYRPLFTQIERKTEMSYLRRSRTIEDISIRVRGHGLSSNE